MFRPNQSCVISKVSGHTDVYGMPIAGVKINERCAVIKMNVVSAKSAVRADTSASRGNARELESDAEFLLANNTTAIVDDIIQVAGVTFLIISRFPRHNLQGKLDHYQVSCTYWSAQ